MSGPISPKHYSGDYESTILRGEEEARPWDIIAEAQAILKPSDSMLDVGCGTAYKTLQLAPLVRRAIGLEPSPNMRERAQSNILKGPTSNFRLVGGRAQELPFGGETFDVVTAMVARHDTVEVRRVLKAGGRVLIEKIGAMDKANIKAEFGADDQGPRGQHGGWSEQGQISHLEAEFSMSFSSVTVRSGYWATYLSFEGLQVLLEQTPAVRDFDRKADKDALERVRKRYMTPRGIKTLQHRVLVYAEV